MAKVPNTLQNIYNKMIDVTPLDQPFSSYSTT